MVFDDVFDSDQSKREFQLLRELQRRTLLTSSLSYTPSFALRGQINQALRNNTPKTIPMASGCLMTDWAMRLAVMEAIPTNFTTSINILAVSSLRDSENNSFINFPFCGENEGIINLYNSQYIYN